MSALLVSFRVSLDVDDLPVSADATLSVSGAARPATRHEPREMPEVTPHSLSCALTGVPMPLLALPQHEWDALAERITYDQSWHEGDAS